MIALLENECHNRIRGIERNQYSLNHPTISDAVYYENDIFGKVLFEGA